jgi:hypothetical protein
MNFSIDEYTPWFQDMVRRWLAARLSQISMNEAETAAGQYRHTRYIILSDTYEAAMSEVIRSGIPPTSWLRAETLEDLHGVRPLVNCVIVNLPGWEEDVGREFFLAATRLIEEQELMQRISPCIITRSESAPKEIPISDHAYQCKSVRSCSPPTDCDYLVISEPCDAMDLGPILVANKSIMHVSVDGIKHTRQSVLNMPIDTILCNGKSSQPSILDNEWAQLQVAAPPPPMLPPDMRGTGTRDAGYYERIMTDHNPFLIDPVNLTRMANRTAQAIRFRTDANSGF